MDRSTLNSRDDFDGWLLFMDDTLSQFFAELLPDIAARLDFTPKSLSVLEHWLLDRYESPTSIMRDSENFVLDRASRYVGETIRRSVPTAAWDIDLENKDMVYYGVPVIRNGGKCVDCPQL